MTHHPRLSVSPALPVLPIDLSKTRHQGFEHEWLAMSFFWLARCFHISGNDEKKEALQMRLQHLVRLYGFDSDLFNKLVEFGNDPSIDWSARVPEIIGVRALQQQMGLSEGEYRLLALAFLSTNSRFVGSMMEFIDHTFCQDSQIDIISQLIGIDRGLFDILSDDNATIVKLNLMGSSHFDFSLSPSDRFKMHDIVSRNIMRCSSIDEDMLAGVLGDSSPAKLTLDDYQHLGDELALLKSCVENATEGGQPLAVLFVGAPGSGKTELAKALAAAAGANLYDVPVVRDDDNKNNNECYRLAEYVRLTHMLSHSSTSHILFDEVEDVLNEKKNAHRRKGWINKTLEERKVTAYWVCNSTHEFDTSFLRRFDYVLFMPTLDYRSRVRMIKDALSAHNISAQRISALASQRIDTAAEIERMRKLVERSQGGDVAIEKVLDLHFPFTPNWYSQELGDFDLAACRASGLLPVTQIAELCEQGANLRVLVHGVNGTGKTSLATHLCYERNQSTRIWHAIDLMSIDANIFIGSMENIFSKAERHRDMLVIDEVDQLFVATQRMLTNPETFYRWFIERVREFRQPLVMTLSNSQVLGDYHQLETACDVSLELKPWTSVQMQPFVNRFAEMHGLNVITLPGHCCATPQQLLQALRQCELHHDLSRLPALLDHKRDSAIGFLATVA
ncbi:AAA family ATPase [Pseudidiomarina sp.]|uniref:ATP-binding protein n=1 Tax=Pseudidiomarina sp. TaxID=2081707 RepID=UPI003A9790AA